MGKMMRIIFFAVFLSATGTVCGQGPSSSYGDYYQICFYHCASNEQLDSMNNYLKGNFVPVLRRKGFKTIGAFLPVTNDTAADKLLVVWIPLKSLSDLSKIGPDIIAPKYTRLETIILTAFEKAPVYHLPKLAGSRQDHIFELRSYESPTEERYYSKVKMFNKADEVSLFTRLNFNAVFYAHVLAGSRMPNLMYMTSFENIASREDHWKSFSNDPAWKIMVALPEYQKNVNKGDTWLMHPTDYSDIY